MKSLMLMAVLAAGDDAETEKFLQAFQQSVEKADTVRVRYELKVDQGGRSQTFMTSTLKLKGDKRWTMEVEMQVPGRFAAREQEKITLIYDGRKLYVVGAPKGMQKPSMDPGLMGRMLRKGIAGMPLTPFLLLQGDRGGPDLNKEIKPKDVKDGGIETVDGRKARVIEYTLAFDGLGMSDRPIAIKLFTDPAGKILLKRELALDGAKVTEEFSDFALDAVFSDSDFKYQSARRLSRVRVAQLATSVELFGRYTGRYPGSLKDLVERPPDLEAEVFWPEGGFVLGGAAPKDPWGRPFELRDDTGVMEVVCLGADGKAGGEGDAEDARVAAPPVTRRPIGAPTDRLRKQFNARVRIQLLTAAIRAFEGSYGELPRKKAALWERPEWAEVWPEGGWLPGGKIPDDPWGDPYRVISAVAYVRVQVRDPKARRLRLTAAESEELEKTARPRLSKKERREVSRLIRDLGDDDLVAREEAHAELKAWGLAAVPLLDEQLKKEKDAETLGRLRMIRAGVRVPPPSWRRELGSLMGIVLPGGSVRGAMRSNERNASASLKTLTSAQADFRSNDRDGNKISDFWTADVAGLYTMTNAAIAGNKDAPLKLIELSIAGADAAPIKAGTAGGENGDIETFTNLSPKAGYHYRAMKQDNSTTPPTPYQADTGGAPTMGKVHNYSRFGFCAYPDEYGVTGTTTFIINEGNTMFKADTQGEPVMEWPSDGDLKAEWSKMD